MKAIIAIFLVTLPIRIFAQTFIPQENGSLVAFTIKNFGISVEGRFTGVSGTITFDDADLTKSQFLITLHPSTIETGIGLRNRHLRGKEYFDVESNPEMKFVSISVTKPDGRFLVTGNLTVRGTTRQISFPFSAMPLSAGIKFEGEFKINRKDFKVGGSSLGMSDEVHVKVSLIAQKLAGT